MSGEQADCLYEIVKLAERDASWTEDRQLEVPHARRLAAILYPGESPDASIRKLNNRIRRLGRYIRSLAAPPRTIDPERLATQPRTAHYLLCFLRLRRQGPVTKHQLHEALLSAISPYDYDADLLEEVFAFACREDYIYPPSPTIPAVLIIGKSLTDQELYLEKLDRERDGK